MHQKNLNDECKELTSIIDNLATGKEICEIADDRFSLADVIDYLKGFLQELIELNAQIADCGNTPELLKKVNEKYTELWLFQIDFRVESLTRVIRGLWLY